VRVGDEESHLSAVLFCLPSRLRTSLRPLKDLEHELEAPKPETRRAAVQKLAALGDRRAWELVLRALGDSESLVADEARSRSARSPIRSSWASSSAERG